MLFDSLCYSFCQTEVEFNLLLQALRQCLPVLVVFLENQVYAPDDSAECYEEHCMQVINTEIINSC